MSFYASRHYRHGTPLGMSLQQTVTTQKQSPVVSTTRLFEVQLQLTGDQLTENKATDRYACYVETSWVSHTHDTRYTFQPQ